MFFEPAQDTSVSVPMVSVIMSVNDKCRRTFAGETGEDFFVGEPKTHGFPKYNIKHIKLPNKPASELAICFVPLNGVLICVGFNPRPSIKTQVQID